MPWYGSCWFFLEQQHHEKENQYHEIGGGAVDREENGGEKKRHQGIVEGGGHGRQTASEATFRTEAQSGEGGEKIDGKQTKERPRRSCQRGRHRARGVFELVPTSRSRMA